MTEWTAFAAITGVVLALLLALARLSAPTVSGTVDATDAAGHDTDADRAEGAPDRPAGPLPDGDAIPERSRHGGRTGRRDRPAGGLPPGALLANVALSQGLFVSFLAVAAWWTRVPLAALGLVPAVSPRLLAVGVGLGVLLWAGNELAGRLGARVGVEGGEEFRAALAPGSVRGWAVLLFCVLPLVALFEEFLFRAALVGALSAGFALPEWPLAAASSVAFAVGHGAQGRAGVVVTGLLGFVLAAGFVLTESLLVVVVAHYLVNALEFLVHERPGG